MIWYVALGGALGSVGRFLLGPLVQRAFGASFPVGTLVINIFGSLLLGFIAGLAITDGLVSANARAFLAVGLCGGFTTFSAFSLETLSLAEGGQRGTALLYVVASVLLSVTATWIGMVVARVATSRP